MSLISRFSQIVSLLKIPALALTALGVVSCSTSQPDTGAVRKVKHFELDLQAEDKVRARDAMIRNERNRRLHGAITPYERRSRQGHYFTIHWKVEDRTVPATVRLEYYQESTSVTLHVKEVEVFAPERSNVTEIAVIGEEFLTNGRVLAHRITVVQGETVVGEQKSFLWE